MTQTIVYPTVMGSLDGVDYSGVYQNYSDLGVYYVGANKGAVRRFYFVFDLFAAPSSGPQLNASSLITAAALEIYAGGAWHPLSAPFPPFACHLYRLTRTNLDGTGTTWLNYRTGTAWTNTGGDFESIITPSVAFSTPAIAAMPATQDLALLNIVQDAQSLRAGKVAVLAIMDNENPGIGNDTFQQYWPALTAPVTLRGHLIITTPGLAGGKQAGYPYKFFVGGIDISGDVGSVSKIASPSATSDITDLLASAASRIYGERDGEIDFNVFYNPAREHPALKPRLKTDQVALLFCGVAIGSAVAALLGKQINYDWARPRDGSLLGTVQVLGDGYGVEWCDALTPGQRTDTAATNGGGLDGGTATAFGLAAYLEVLAFAGTSVTVKLQDSADNAAWADIAGAAFTVITAAPAQERIVTALTATVRRYVRAITTGTFTNCVFACAFDRYLGAEA